MINNCQPLDTNCKQGQVVQWEFSLGSQAHFWANTRLFFFFYRFLDIHSTTFYMFCLFIRFQINALPKSIYISDIFFFLYFWSFARLQILILVARDWIKPVYTECKFNLCLMPSPCVKHMPSPPRLKSPCRQRDVYTTSFCFVFIVISSPSAIKLKLNINVRCNFWHHKLFHCAWVGTCDTTWYSTRTRRH